MKYNVKRHPAYRKAFNEGKKIGEYLSSKRFLKDFMKEEARLTGKDVVFFAIIRREDSPEIIEGAHLGTIESQARSLMDSMRRTTAKKLRRISLLKLKVVEVLETFDQENLRGF